MKLTCSQQILSKALNTVTKAVTSRTTIPILKGILLETTDQNHLKMAASDLDLSIEKKIPATIHMEGSVILSAKLFSDIIRKLPNEEVEIELIENNQVVVRCLSSEFIIVGHPADEFPKIGAIKAENKISIDREIMKDMIKKTSFSASIEEAKGVIMGVLLELEEDHLSMVALDGFRMAITKEAMKNEKKKKIIIAARILNEINKIIAESEEDGPIDLVLEEKKAVIFMEDTLIVSRLLEGEFIKYKDIIPKEYKSRLILKREEMMESIERASLLAREGKNNLIKFSVFRDKIIITSRSEEGNVKEEVFIEKEGEDLEIGFNAKYIADVMKAVSDEEIVMELNSSISPCIIKPKEGESFLYMVLPVRITAN